MGRGGLILVLFCLSLTSIVADNKRVFYEITEEGNATACDKVAKNVYTGFGSISIVCLLATIFVHWWVAHLNNLHGKILISCSASTILATTYLLIVYNYDLRQDEYHVHKNEYEVSHVAHPSCTLFGYFGVYANLSMFSWMTVLCFNMLRRFKRMELKIIFEHLKRFLAYSIFGWGVPLIFCVATLIAQSAFPKDSTFNPLIGQRICFVDREGSRQFIFFYGPMLIFLLINCVGFISTITKVWRASARKLSGSKFKGSFRQYLLYMFAMKAGETRQQFVSKSNFSA